MSTAPNGKVAHAAGATGGRVAPAGSIDKSSAKSIDKASGAKSLDQKGPAGKKLKPKMTADQRTQMIVVSIAALIVFGVGIGMYAYLRSPETQPQNGPRVDEPTPAFVQHVMGPDFDNLPFRRQKTLLMDLAEPKRKKEIEAMRTSGQMQLPVYRDAIAYVWIGKGLHEMDHYYSLGAKEQANYIEKIVDDKFDPPKPKELHRNEDKVTSVLKRFPSDDRTAFNEFQAIIEKAYKKRKQEMKEADRKGRLEAATRPTTHTSPPAPKPTVPAPKPVIPAPKPQVTTTPAGTR